MKKSSKILYVTDMPYYEVFFDQDMNLITYIHENDAHFRSEYQEPLFKHFGITVKHFELSGDVCDKISEHFEKYDLDYDTEKFSLEEALIEKYVKPCLEKVAK